MKRLILALLLMATFARGQSTTAPAEEVLKSKGLTRSGTIFIVEADAKLPDGLRAVRQAKKQLDENARKRQSMEATIRSAENTMEQWNREYRELNEKLPKQSGAVQHNWVVSQINVLVSKITEGEKYLDDRRKELKELSDPRDDYVSAVLELAEKMEAGAKQYAALAADEQVKAALAQLNEKAPPKLKLGPSAQFAQELPGIRKRRDEVNAAVIKFEVRNGIAVVNVILNGTASQSMLLDSGASYICLTADAAKKAGVKRKDSDAKTKMTIADGSQIEGFVSKLKSVRLGQFTVGDVECVVLPDSVKGAENLLGGSFLRHFVYRMDLSAGELHMAQMSGKMASPDEPFDGAHRPKTITQAPPSTAASPATRPLAGGMKLPTGSFKILGPKGVQCLAIHDDSRNAGDGLVMAQPGKSAGQLWTAPAASDGFVKLQNKNSGLILAIRQAKTDAGADIIQWNDTGGEEQQWTIESAGGSFVKIICKHSGMCLTRGNARAKEPEAMTQQPSSDSREQLWLIVPK